MKKKKEYDARLKKEEEKKAAGLKKGKADEIIKQADLKKGKIVNENLIKFDERYCKE